MTDTPAGATHCNIGCFAGTKNQPGDSAEKREGRPASLQTAHTGPHSRPKGNWQPAHNQPAQSLQDDLDKLVKWSEKWQMLLNFWKCKCVHIGHGNMDEEYNIGYAVLGRTTQEKDLGVTFSAHMKVSEQCGIAASKGNQIIGLIRRTITYNEKQLIVPLYKAIVRPHLEYCIQAWIPHRKKEIYRLERVQRRATKIIPDLRELS